MSFVILDLEATFGLGVDGFGALEREAQERLLAWWNVKHLPEDRQDYQRRRRGRAKARQG